MFLRSLTCALGLALGLSLQSAASAQEDEITAFYQEVMVALSNQPRPAFPVESEALIAFTVADDGTLETAEVVQSSGSAPIDAAALLIVENAAPFPAPPEGAKRRLSVTIQSTRPTLSFAN